MGFLTPLSGPSLFEKWTGRARDPRRASQVLVSLGGDGPGLTPSTSAVGLLLSTSGLAAEQALS